MYTAMLIDDDEMHAETLTVRFRARGLDVMRHTEADRALSVMHKGTTCDLMLINVSDSSQPWLRIVRELQDASFSFSHWPPLVLCLSTVKRDPQFELQVERLGARFVYER
jgi:DNA-binding NarL/FixJ family response regulator